MLGPLVSETKKGHGRAIPKEAKKSFILAIFAPPSLVADPLEGDITLGSFFGAPALVVVLAHVRGMAAVQMDVVAALVHELVGLVVAPCRHRPCPRPNRLDT
jgi:hypothetical protein